MKSEKQVQKFHTDDVSLPNEVVLSIGWRKFHKWHNQSEAVPGSG